MKPNADANDEVTTEIWSTNHKVPNLFLMSIYIFNVWYFGTCNKDKRIISLSDTFNAFYYLFVALARPSLENFCLLFVLLYLIQPIRGGYLLNTQGFSYFF